MRIVFLRRLWLAIVFLSMFLTGCIGLVPSPFRPSPGPQKNPQIYDLAEAFDIVCRNYRLGPDDTVRVLYQTEWNIPRGSYRLDTLDVIEVSFILDPSLNKEVVIRPDGMITLNAVGDVLAAGRTPEELAKAIEQRYLDANIFSKDEAREELKNYKLVTVTVKSFYEKVKELVKSLTTLVGGSQTDILVKPDGTIDLPLMKERILAAGHTVPEVEFTANKIYRQSTLRNVVVSVALASAKSRKVYILGQVNQPGAYEIQQPITALHAVALAGGHIPDSADMTSVILISKNIHGKPIGRRLDLKRILDVGDMSAAILVKPYDVLYVPKTYVRDLRVFMEQYFQTVGEIAEFVETLVDIRRKSRD